MNVTEVYGGQLLCINLVTIFEMFAENLILVLGSYVLKLPKGYKVGVGNVFIFLEVIRSQSEGL